VWSMAPELNSREGGGPVARGATLSSGEPLGPAHEDRKQVRWLGINGITEVEVRRGGGGLPKANKSTGADERQWGGLLL
jgi:hypothetical protein